MPVVIVTAAPLADTGAEQRALTAIAVAVAGDLRLRPEDVYVTLCHSATSVLGTSVVPARPVVALHGSRRPAPDTAAAAASAGRAAAAAWGCPVEDVWVQWLVRAELP